VAHQGQDVDTQGLLSEDKTNSQKPTRFHEQSRADEKSSKELTRRDAFKGQRVLAHRESEETELRPQKFFI